MSGHLLAFHGAFVSLSSLVPELLFHPSPLSFSPEKLVPQINFLYRELRIKCTWLAGVRTPLLCIFLVFGICDLGTASWSFIPPHLWGNEVGTKGKSESAHEYLESSVIDTLGTIRFEIG